MVRAAAAGILIICVSSSAAADPQIDVESDDLIYVEALGKLGLYGLGYERQLHRWVSAGIAGSVYGASGRTGVATSAYVGLGSALRGRHRWFAQLGPQLVHEREPAVPGFDGLSTTALGGQITGGYEYRADRWLIRGHAVLAIGRGGVAPWAGASFGVRL
jgi:hypothetical protein